MASEAVAKRASDKPAPAPSPAVPSESAPLFAPLRDLDRKGKLLIAGLILLANIPLIHYFFRHVLRPMPVSAQVPFSDSFDRADVGPNYWSTGGDWRIEHGWLHAAGVKNNPLWLKASLPQNVAIDFDAKGTAAGDIKFELFGDGLNHGSGYVFMFGGWNNQLTAIARYDERSLAFNAQGVGLSGPANDAAQNAVSGRSLRELYANHTLGPSSGWRVQRGGERVQPGTTYHMHIERRGGDIKWMIDGNLVLEVDDPSPLTGSKHDRFAFSGWEASVFYGHLTIQKL